MATPSSLENRPADRARSAVDECGAGKRVLVVEDEPSIRVVLTDLLSDARYAVLQAADGGEALETLQTTVPDLIILDLMMPSVSGWRFLQARQSLPRANRVPVIVLSVIDGRHDYPAAIGAAAWLGKPIDVPRFLGTVEQLVH
jgi:CheY-like chemotaxis protein